MASIPSSVSGELSIGALLREFDHIVAAAQWAQVCYMCQRGRAWPAQPVWFHRFMWEHSRGIARRLPGT